MFYRTQIKNIGTGFVIDEKGKTLYFTGSLSCNIGDSVWTDGTFVFGHTPIRGTPLIFNQSAGGIPVVCGSLRGYFDLGGNFKDYPVVGGFVVNDDRIFRHGGISDEDDEEAQNEGEAILDAEISDDGALLVAKTDRSSNVPYYLFYEGVVEDDYHLVIEKNGVKIKDFSLSDFWNINELKVRDYPLEENGISVIRAEFRGFHIFPDQSWNMIFEVTFKGTITVPPYTTYGPHFPQKSLDSYIRVETDSKYIRVPINYTGEEALEAILADVQAAYAEQGIQRSIEQLKTASGLTALTGAFAYLYKPQTIIIEYSNRYIDDSQLPELSVDDKLYYKKSYLIKVENGQATILNEQSADYLPKCNPIQYTDDPSTIPEGSVQSVPFTIGTYERTRILSTLDIISETVDNQRKKIYAFLPVVTDPAGEPVSDFNTDASCVDSFFWEVQDDSKVEFSLEQQWWDLERKDIDWAFDEVLEKTEGIFYKGQKIVDNLDDWVDHYMHFSLIYYSLSVAEINNGFLIGFYQDYLLKLTKSNEGYQIEDLDFGLYNTRLRYLQNIYKAKK